MVNIKEIVKGVIDRIAQKKPDTQFQLEGVWVEALDDNDRKHTQLVGIKNGKVSILVDSPAWLHQMRIKKSTILKKLQSKIPDIVEIQFRVGKV